MSNNAATRRRNGRQPACEPCRLRKVACNHGLPVCSRCERAGMHQACMYILDTRPARRLAPAVNTFKASQVLSGAFGPPDRLTPTLTPTVTPELTPTRREKSLPLAEDPGGFFGATSMCAVLQETRNTILLSQNQESSGCVLDESSATAALPMPEAKSEQMALEVLRNIPHKATCFALFEMEINPNDGWCRLAVRRTLESMWECFGGMLEGRRSHKSMLELAQVISRNTSVPLNENAGDSDEWLRGFTGENLRWESLGILFKFWSFGTIALAQHSPPSETARFQGYKPNDNVIKYKEMAWKCAQLSQELNAGNTLLVYLLYQHTLLEMHVTGDAGMRPWRLHADAVSIVTLLGLHTSSRKSLQHRTAALQVKRKLFAAVYSFDKMQACFTGRPPLLTGKFCSVPLPLDISDEVLLGKNLATASDAELHLDERGWNTDGKIYSTTLLRARTMLSFIRDGILEIALLAPEYEGDHTEELRKLRSREMDVLAQFPTALIYAAGDSDSPHIDGPTLYTKLLVRLLHLQNLFFIERLLSKTEVASKIHLVEISYEKVNLSMVFWTRQNRLRGLQGHFQWLVVSYAAPAAGILCMELLRPSPPGMLSMTRSDIIQQLSLLIAFLDWVSPAAPNGYLCGFVKKVVKHVLDQTLNLPAAPPPVQSNEFGDWETQWSADVNDLFSFDLLQTFDWLRPEGAEFL